jgi:hypothetical protein
MFFHPVREAEANLFFEVLIDQLGPNHTFLLLVGQRLIEAGRAERLAGGQGMDGFNPTGLALGIGPEQHIEARPGTQALSPDIPEVHGFKFGNEHSPASLP